MRRAHLLTEDTCPSAADKTSTPLWCAKCGRLTLALFMLTTRSGQHVPLCDICHEAATRGGNAQ